MSLEISTLNTSALETHTQHSLELNVASNTQQHFNTSPNGSIPEQTEQSSKIELRDYQKTVIASTYSYIRQGVKRILLVAIMGSGKTIIASWIMRDAVSRQRRCLFLVALNVLLDQTANTLQKLGVECSVLQGDRKFDIEAPVVVASLQTIGARLRAGKTLDEILGQVNVCIVDEAHITSFMHTYIDIEQYYSEQKTVFLGLTATPWRLSQKEWLGQRFDALVVGPQPPEIIKLGGALPCRGFTLTNALDLDDLHIRNGEYIDSEMSEQACRYQSLENVFYEWQRLCSDRPTLMIGVTVAQAKATRDSFLEHGIAAEMIVGTTPTEERHEIFKRVASGETQVITSVGCLTSGFDLPCISAILYVRATKSKALFHQSAGRGSRPFPGKKDYFLLDFGANLKRHRNPMGFQDYDIFTPKEPPPSLTKTCPSCGHECYLFALVCPVCGHEFEIPENEGDEYEEDEFSSFQLNEYYDSFTKKNQDS